MRPDVSFLGGWLIPGPYGVFPAWLIGCLLASGIIHECSAQPLVLSEFMASNVTGLADEDGDRSDWIEITNLGERPIPLEGYFLSDDPENPTQWSFPDISLAAQSSMIVFASGKDRSLVGKALHTSFKLAKEGGFLGLADPNGQWVEHAHVLAYPPQLPDISYGLDMQIQQTKLVAGDQEVRFQFPTEDLLGDSWTSPDFDDLSWQVGNMGLGYIRDDAGDNEDDANAEPSPTDEPLVLADVSFPGDKLKATSDRSPNGEGVEGVIDNNTATKYLNFDKLDSGFTIELARGSVAVIGLILTSANDAPDRDPTSYVLSGSHDGTRFHQVAQGRIPVFENRFQSHQLNFPNPTAYRHYRLIFSSVRDPGIAVAMQIAEVELLGWVSATSLQEPSDTQPELSIDLAGLEDVSQPGDTILPTTNNSPAGEEVWLAIDNNPQAKYLNFDGAGSGFVLEPQVGLSVLNGLRLTSANDAPGRDPATYLLEGSSDGVLFETIASGDLPAFEDRFAEVEVGFANSKAYLFYRLTFPTLTGGSGQLMQIGEVAFLGRTGPGLSDVEDLIQTNLEPSMFGKHASALVRCHFVLEDLSQIQGLSMRMRYVDGFVAYLNGVEVARSNAPTDLSLGATALNQRALEEAMISEFWDLQAFAPLLQEGHNVLAVRAMDDAMSSSSFLVELELVNEERAWTPSQWGHLKIPSPGKPNGGVWQGLLTEPHVDQQSGFYANPIRVSLGSTDSAAEIYYTTDGRRPDAQVGRLYQGPIVVDQTTILRAIALLEGWKPSPLATRTYLYTQDIISQSADSKIMLPLPPKWGTQAADYGLDPRVAASNQKDAYQGRYAKTLQQDLLAVPSLSLVMDPQDWFGPQGIYANPTARASGSSAWERQVSVEWIPTDTQEGFRIEAGIKIQGGAFRRFDLTLKKSFRLLFKNPYGPTKLKFPVFGKEATDEFDNLVLRANGNDGYPYGGGGALYMRDAFAMETARSMGMIVPHTTFVHLYLNGAYWGLYNVVERPDAAFSSTYHGGNKDDWDALNQDSVPDGTREAWDRLLALLNQDMVDDETFYRVQGKNAIGLPDPAIENLLDVANLIDYCLLNFYIGNQDWPGRNHWYGRDRHGSQGFQFYPWDSETALGLGSGLEANSTGANTAVARPYAALRANARFRQWFGDRAHAHFSRGGAFYVNPEQPQWSPAMPENNPSAARFAGLTDQIAQAMVGESARWGDQKGTGPYTRDEHWSRARDSLLANYFPKRTQIVMDQLRRAGLYPTVEAPVLHHPGGKVERGYALSMETDQGTIYYTLDGTDPQTKLEGVETARHSLVQSQTPRWVLVPSTQNGGSTLDDLWKVSLEMPLAGWQGGEGGVGYDTAQTYQSLIGMDLSQNMPGQNRSAYIRIPFEAEAGLLDDANFLMLRMRYDDGFAAWINGTEVAKANAPDNLIWNSFASGANPDEQALVFETFDISEHLKSLHEGSNLLAIHGLNVSSTSSDFLIDVELVLGRREVIGEEPTAHVYQSPIVLNDAMTIKARTLLGAQWSALTTADFVVGQPQLQVSELHYHPAAPSEEEAAAGFDDADDFEFIEFFNPSLTSFPLLGVHFTDGVSFDFSQSTIQWLRPGETVLVVSNQLAFEQRYGQGLPVAGVYVGNFSNSGERVCLADAQDNVIVDFVYDDEVVELKPSDGNGYSLNALGGMGIPERDGSWQLSHQLGGSPGQGPLSGNSTLLHPTLSIDQDTIIIQCQAPLNGDYGLYASQDLHTMQWDLIHARSQVLSLDSLRFEIDLDAVFPVRFFQIRHMTGLP